MRITARRIATTGAFAVAAAAPIAAALLAGGAVQSTAGPCLSWIGNKEDGVCAGYSNGNGISVGTPAFGSFDNGNGYGPGLGVNSGPLLPGTTINRGIG